jgi:(1->4)-alpha-D-glucan 1-alpha-D-glucosylmutase
MKSSTLKACREAKIHTSWISPNEAYENAVIRFVEETLAAADGQFMRDFLSFHKKVSWFGMLNSLSQVFFKLVIPGIPDIYQGNEIWRYCLVDPDNRRPVDFSRRQTMLFSMLDRININGEIDSLQREILANLTDGRAKMYVIYRTLQLRNSFADFFDRANYLPLQVTGSKSIHLCAFLRKSGDRVIIAAAPRLYLTLMKGKMDLPLGEEVWGDTAITLPSEMELANLENIYADNTGTSDMIDSSSRTIQVGRLLRSWPVALLKGTVE